MTKNASSRSLRFVQAAVALIAFASLSVACGADRESDDALPTEATPESADDAAGDDAAGDGEEAGDVVAGEDEVESPAAPVLPTIYPADEVALTADFDGDTLEVTHGELDAIAVPTWENEAFFTNALGGTIPPDFRSGILTQFVVAEILDRELSAAGGAVSPEALDEAKQGIMPSIQSWFPTSEDSAADAEAAFSEALYIPFIVDLQARQQALASALAESEEGPGVPCVSHILVDAEADADAVVTELAAGADFAEVAKEKSTGPSGPAGGELGCAESANYVPEFAAAVDDATLGEVVGPVETEFGWHVILVDRFEVDGNPLAVAKIEASLKTVTVEVDPRLGTWDATTFQVTPAA